MVVYLSEFGDAGWPSLVLLSNPRAHRTLHISRSHSVLPALFVSLCLCGCGPSNTLDQDVVSLDVRADVGPATQRVTVEITGADVEEDPAVDLEVTDEVASGDIEVTRGSDRTLRIIVYDSRRPPCVAELRKLRHYIGAANMAGPTKG